MSDTGTADQIRAASQPRKPRRRIKPSQDPAENQALLLRVLEHIAEHGDLLDNGPHLPWADTDFRHTGQWLIVPVAKFMLDALALFESNLEGLEDGADREPDEIDNDEVDGEDGGDIEPSLGATTALDQRDAGWHDDGQPTSLTDLERDTGDAEPDDADMIWSPDWKPHTFLPDEDAPPDPQALGLLPVFATSDEEPVPGRRLP